MKEYNWRKEREKYRPDFRKEETQPQVNVCDDTPQSINWSKILIPVIVIIVLLAVLVAVFAGCFGSKDSTKQLTEAAEKNKEAVGLVTVMIEMKDGSRFVEPVGTAWAFAENKFATNAHVAHGLKTTAAEKIKILVQALLTNAAKENGCSSLDEWVKKIGQEKAQQAYQQAIAQIQSMISAVKAEIRINSVQNKKYAVTYVQIHKDYGVVDSSYNPDLAVLTVQGKHDSFLKLAPEKKLHKLKSGTPIAFLGFPMERLGGEKGNVNPDYPIASMQSGIIVAVSDFDLKDAGAENNVNIRHNLPSAGGASGSPIFDTDGEVVAALWGGNMIGQVVATASGTAVTRAPSAAQINYAVRIDLLDGMGETIAIQDFLK